MYHSNAATSREHFIQSPLVATIPGGLSSLDRVTEALTTHGSHGRGTSWQCPAHDDRTASLSVSNGNGKVLLYCHAGCSTEDIVAELGLDMKDLFDEPLPDRRDAEVRYPYTDEHGTVLYYKVRKPGKDFLQQLPDGSWKLGDTRRVLYRLPQLVGANEVWYVEGEKDADRLASMGLTATTAGGCKSWRPEFADFFKGKNVTIIADNDLPGLTLAEQVFKAITGIAKSVKILKSPLEKTGSDVSDHLDAGMTMDQLVLPAPVPVQAEDSEDSDLDRFEFVDWYKAWEAQPDSVEWLMEPVIERGSCNVIYSEAGIGKSLVTQEIAASIARSGEIVMYIDSENRIRDYVERLSDMGYTPASLQNLKLLSFPSLPPLDTHKGGDFVLRLAKKTGAVLVVIDTTMRFVDGKENDSDTFNAMYKHTMVPLKGAGIASLRLDHAGKDGTRGQRGSSAKNGDVDSVWKLTHPQRGKNRWLENEKDRTGHCVDKVRLEIFTEPHLAHVWSWHKRSETPKAVPFDEKTDARVEEVVRQLDKLQIPLDMGRDKVKTVLKDHGLSYGTTPLASAIALRKKRGPVLETVSGQVGTGDSGNQAGPVLENLSPTPLEEWGQVGQVQQPVLEHLI